MNITEILPGPGSGAASNLIPEKTTLRERAVKNLEIPEPENQGSLTSLDLEKLDSTVNSIKEYMNSMGVKLEFHIHEASDKVQVRVLNPETKRVIREIPPDEILDLAASIEEMLGLFLNKSL